LTVAVLRFPGSNCDQDALWALRVDVGVGAEYVWHEATSLDGFGAVFVPGGFSYGDYLRCGAMAARSPVIGACNGFQILCEAGLLPGALVLNEEQRFVCDWVWLRAETRRSPWTEAVDRPIRIPIAHGEGRYVCDPQELARLEDEGRVAFRYVDAEGRAVPDANPNGSVNGIAGVLNGPGNVLGLMPHPERATKALLGSTDGRLVLKALERVHTA
jgi:phosphoribosylformylglycinamidine synthase subunit PurQ / glutaminase